MKWLVFGGIALGLYYISKKLAVPSQTELLTALKAKAGAGISNLQVQQNADGSLTFTGEIADPINTGQTQKVQVLQAKNATDAAAKIAVA